MSGSEILALGATNTSSRYARLYHRSSDAQMAVAFRVCHDAKASRNAQREHHQLARTIDSGCRDDDLGSSIAHPSDHHAAEHGATDEIQY